MVLPAFSAQRPTLCIFRGHPLDRPSTLELLELIINQIQSSRTVLLIVSHRPEFDRWVVTRCQPGQMHLPHRVVPSEVWE